MTEINLQNLERQLHTKMCQLYTPELLKEDYPNMPEIMEDCDFYFLEKKEPIYPMHEPNFVGRQFVFYGTSTLGQMLFIAPFPYAGQSAFFHKGNLMKLGYNKI